MQLQLFDAFGLGAGGSGAAAGLLHPYTPRGKVGLASTPIGWTGSSPAVEAAVPCIISKADELLESSARSRWSAPEPPRLLA